MSEPLAYEPQPEFRENIFGTLGVFGSPAGDVSYLLTRARLGAAGTDPERRLAEHIVPFREVIPARELEFAQLLQRDINDFRVAEELIPYMLHGPAHGPAMFPPILCVILPFEGPNLAETFPGPTEIPIHEERGLYLTGWRRGDAFRVERLVTRAGEDYPMAVARLGWNTERARVVVLDGQHRAMAMLAVQRTLTRTWDDSRGREYRAFYDRTVKRHLEGIPAGFDLERLQIPVAICWFDGTDGGLKPHQAARQLFVDVNREAKPPSPSRLTLLSETELLSIFSRSLLDVLRVDGSDQVPLSAVEFDNPERESYRPVKWSVTTTIDIIKHAIQYAVFGPRDLIESANKPMSRGRRSPTATDRFMRHQLDLGGFLAAVIEDGDRRIMRDAVGNLDFPRSHLPEIIEAFRSSWGAAIIHLLTWLQPFADHNFALRKLETEWKQDDIQGRLAFSAIFEGTGLYWTLRSTHAHWVSRERPPELRSEAVEAWERIEEQREAFDALRAEQLLGERPIGQAEVAAANRIFSVLRTAASQVGLVMSVASVALESGLRRNDILSLTESMVRGSNLALSKDDRWRFLDSDASKPLVRITAMNTPMAVHFRYFWLELLATPAGLASLNDTQAEAVRQLAQQGRSSYLDLLVRQEDAALGRGSPELSPAGRGERAESSARRYLAEALSRWFGIENADFDTWYQSERGSEIDEDDTFDDEELGI